MKALTTVPHDLSVTEYGYSVVFACWGIEIGYERVVVDRFVLVDCYICCYTSLTRAVLSVLLVLLALMSGRLQLGMYHPLVTSIALIL